jgi:pyruvate dehydrogenase E2 component (dihydrolipoamide acetyltransferase)
VPGTGPKSRILPEDLHAWVKQALSASAAPKPEGQGQPAAAGSGDLVLAPWPKVDFAKFGPIERRPLSRIKKLTGQSLHRNWVRIPHVTSQEEADITELEAFRLRVNDEQAALAKQAQGQKPAAVKMTLLSFLLKAAASALHRFPEVNSSLDGDELVLKQYVHLGFAADTPQGLLVPVIRDADKKGLLALAAEASDLAAKARDGKLSPAEMTGATFSISSLGSIGGGYFTPIINAPEVAILGVGRAAMAPRWDGEKFVPRLILPLALSWDHRVLDGALAARFNAHLAAVLGDPRRLLL